MCTNVLQLNYHTLLWIVCSIFSCITISGNVITGNQWGGIDIRHGGDPIIHHNTVCNGISDGIVIGEGGQGSVQNNVITGGSRF